MVGRSVDLIFGAVCVAIFAGGALAVQCWQQENSASCCNNFITHRTCGLAGHDCSDLPVSNPAYQTVEAAITGLDSYQNNTTVTCTYDVRECELIGCKDVQKGLTGQCIDQTVTGNSCSQPGPGGGGTVSPEPIGEPLPE